MGDQETDSEDTNSTDEESNSNPSSSFDYEGFLKEHGDKTVRYLDLKLGIEEQDALLDQLLNEEEEVDTILYHKYLKEPIEVTRRRVRGTPGNFIGMVPEHIDHLEIQGPDKETTEPESPETINLQDY